MQKTIFDTPILTPCLRFLSRNLLTLLGWQVEGRPEVPPRCVLIAAPHTSNWDLPYMLMVAFVLRMKIYWMGKREIFKPPFAGIMHWLGGIAVDRSKANNMVAATAAHFGLREQLMIAVPPEGTRGKVRQWKSGFYYIAAEAGVPIQLSYLDFGRRRTGLGPVVVPSGDYDSDLETIKEFYVGMKGKNEL